MDPESILEAWVPPGAAWSPWVKPVLFAQMPASATAQVNESASNRDVAWVPRPDEHVVLVLDLPGAESVYLGLALATCGYRPIPLFNACTGPNEVVVQDAIQRALLAGAPSLLAQSLPLDAPPAFLLDQLRRSPVRPVRPGAFDNRWQVYPEDLPSGHLLLGRGFSRVLLVQPGSQPRQDDLALVMWQWQEAGLAIMVKDLASAPQPLRVPRPSPIRRLWHHLLSFLGLRQRPAQGFGYVVPEPTHG